VLQAEEVWSKSVNKTAHFILGAEVDTRLYLDFHCSDLTETSNLEITAHELQTVEVRMKTVNNEGYFT
jgi:hypothetical protein